VLWYRGGLVFEALDSWITQLCERREQCVREVCATQEGMCEEERIFIELMTSDRKFKASREVWK